MDNKQPQNSTARPADRQDPREHDSGDEPRPREIGGRNGPEPTRFGDWEKAGRCVDF
jgi:hypothetical protein